MLNLGKDEEWLIIYEEREDTSTSMLRNQNNSTSRSTIDNNSCLYLICRFSWSMLSQSKLDKNKNKGTEIMSNEIKYNKGLIIII